MLSQTHVKALQERGLDPIMVEEFGVNSIDRSGDEFLEIPYLQRGQRVNTKYRTLGTTKRFTQDAGATKCFWNYDVIGDQALALHPLIITEGEMDAFAAIQAGFTRVVSVPDGAPSEEIGDKGSVKYSYLEDARNDLRDVKEIILCTDDDGPGIALMNDLALRLNRARCKWVKYPKGCKDLNDALAKYGPRGVTETITRAQWLRLDGLYRMSEIPPVPPREALDIGMMGLAGKYKMRPGDFTVITGIPSHGKSTFVNEIAGRMASDPNQWNVIFASFEQEPLRDHRRALRTFYSGCLEYEQTPEQRIAADKWIEERFTFMVPNEDDDVDLTWVLERAQAGILQYGAKLVVIDPWNDMDHIRPPDMSLTEYTGYAIKQFRKLAKKYEVHVIVVAHPTKLRPAKPGDALQPPTLYDISDSAHWANKADVGIVIHKMDVTTTLIRVQKVRYHDVIGKPGDIEAKWNRETGRYEPVKW